MLSWLCWAPHVDQVGQPDQTGISVGLLISHVDRSAPQCADRPTPKVDQSRRLNVGCATADEKWTCSDNSDVKHNKCSASQELPDAAIDVELAEGAEDAECSSPEDAECPPPKVWTVCAHCVCPLWLPTVYSLYTHPLPLHCSPIVCPLSAHCLSTCLSTQHLRAQASLAQELMQLRIALCEGNLSREEIIVATMHTFEIAVAWATIEWNL